MHENDIQKGQVVLYLSRPWLVTGTGVSHGVQFAELQDALSNPGLTMRVGSTAIQGMTVDTNHAILDKYKRAHRAMLDLYHQCGNDQEIVRGMLAYSGIPGFIGGRGIA